MIVSERIFVLGAWRGRVLALLACCGLVVAAAPRAEADDCLGASMSLIRPEDSKLFLDLRHKDDVWQARVSTYGTTDGTWRTLEGVPEHGHLVAVGPIADGTFAIVRASAGVDHTDRVLFFNGFAPTRSQPERLKPRRRLALKDFMTADELAGVQRSVSHLQWLTGDTPVSGLDITGARPSFKLSVVGGRVVTIPFPVKRSMEPKPWSIRPW